MRIASFVDFEFGDPQRRIANDSLLSTSLKFDHDVMTLLSFVEKLTTGISKPLCKSCH